MTLCCIKTGFYAQLPNGLYARGDAFATLDSCFDWPDEPVRFPPNTLLLRICAVSSEEPPAIHIKLETWDEWFDERNGQSVSTAADEVAVIYQPNSTLVACPGQWSWLGYVGQLPTQEPSA